ncbi:MAG: Asp-tRNA(Asn)/Glu-tRNA(Gln) amidotransferase subunit GatC [Candidatus Eremiobacteraeota bacterium]|nr:Asp-tRNA(Asn)/Glu-tRNA(Gln) amidotransferase subunit GatC [Candidatus Eremiobacteraeota bacterium]MBC5827855.1 Asp-tRNA(Asn)/Glu-tRNA(Gln) amidotransferase subunit GatC [Candidatus Eremiobacteraeota bacterium]
MADVPIDIHYVAKLARLSLTDEESARISAQLSRLFDFIGELQGLDVSGVHPTAQVIPLANVYRDDVVKPSLSNDEALANAPQRDGPYFKAPRILEGEF